VNQTFRPAREPRSRAVFLCALGLAAALAGAASAAPVDEGLKPWAFRYGKCQDDKVAGLVGRTVDDALKQVRPMRLMAVRVLDRYTPVNLEVVPERLTLVVHDNGVVIRAFCR
jgi:hypothetical protein